MADEGEEENEVNHKTKKDRSKAEEQPTGLAVERSRRREDWVLVPGTLRRFRGLGLDFCVLPSGGSLYWLDIEN